MRIKLTLLLMSSLTVMAGAAIAPSLPAIADAFATPGDGRDTLWVKLILTVPALAIAVTAPVSGVIIDAFGRRRTLVAGLCLYALAGTSGLYLDTLGAILVGRFILGIGVAGTMTASTTLIGDLFHGEARLSMMSLQAASMSFTAVVCLVGGGLLAELTWRDPFAIYGIAALCVPLVFAVLPEPPRATHTDAESGTLVPPEGGERGGPTPWPAILINYGAGLFGMAMFYLVVVQVPFLVEHMTGAGGAVAGVAIACITFTSGLMSLAYRPIKRRIGFHPIFAILFGIMAASFLVIGTANSLAQVFAGLLLGGLGGGLLMPNVNLCLLTHAPPRLRGKLVGGLTASLFLGQFLSPLLAAPLVGQHGPAAAFTVAAAALAATAAGFALLSRRGASVPHHAA